MNIFAKQGQAKPKRVALAQLTTAISSIPQSTASSVTMLGLSNDNLPTNDVDQEIVAAYSAAGRQLSEVERTAAVQTAYALADVDSHTSRAIEGYETAITGKDVANGSLALVGAGGNIGTEAVNMQAYEKRDFSKFKEVSIDFNIAHATLDAVSEMFFPSLLLPADQPIMRSELRSTFIQRFQSHGSNGAPMDLGRKNLAHAYSNPEILENSTTTIVPVVAADDSNAEYFIPAATVAPKTVNVSGHSVRTAPLKIGVEGNLLSLAANGAFAPDEGYDNYDQLSPRVNLHSVDVSVVRSGGSAATSQLELVVAGLPRSNFVQTNQQDSNEDFTLNFATDVITVDADTLDRDGVKATALAGVEANVKLKLRITVFAKLNLNTTNYEFTAVRVQVLGALRDGAPVAIEGALADAVNELSFEANGATLGELTLTNSNSAESGLWIETSAKSRDFVVGIQAPIYHPLPQGKVVPQDMVDSLIATAKATSSARGINAIRNHLDALANYTSMGDHGITSSEMFPGAADEIKPFYRSIDIDVKQKLNSISTHEKGDDIKALFSTILTHYLSEMITKSNIQTARELLHGTNEKLQVIIATDPDIAPWLMTSGDADFLGRMVEYKVATTVNPAMKGRIVMSFASDTSLDGLDPCGFGRRGWTNELISTKDIQRGNSSNTEVSIATRELPVAVLPVALEFVVTNLEEAITSTI